MGCDIHIITEIRKEGKWEYVPETPKTLDMRNYTTFAVLAGVRDYFGCQVFEAKGLPGDISNKRFDFISSRDRYLQQYETGIITALCEPDGTLSPVDHRIRCKISKPEYDDINTNGDKDSYKSRYTSLGWCETAGERTYYVYDAAVLNGTLKQVLYKELYSTFDDYLKAYWSDEYDQVADDYGYWRINFDCRDYHSHSYLSLKELLEADYSNYATEKFKLEKSFYKTFIAAGGEFPSIFTIKEESPIGDIADAMREAFNPTVLVSWAMDEESKKNLLVFKGIEELKEIACKYNVENPEDIRIVFAFDN